ncbi:hypothetical protein FD755_003671 [Muntiacus reevesi]|uniref:Sulfotransferase n=1 Tax=Muntiacus reevesi TaxID=9886 RepID=A0A5J5MNH5_MUNRE|nr:hypothetical protein FD755_003671 [Muntiacus reevesi]
MGTAQSALLEREAPESSTTDEELAGRRAANGSSNAVSTPDYGEKKLPQALIIGVKKGGTRALLEAIRVHPDVRAVGVEPHFFDRNYEKGLEWYRSICVYMTVGDSGGCDVSERESKKKLGLFSAELARVCSHLAKQPRFYFLCVTPVLSKSGFCFRLCCGSTVI